MMRASGPKNKASRARWLGALFGALALACSVLGSSLDHFTEGGGSTACPKGLVKCGEACVDTRSDPSHCGSCGAACPSGQVCDTSACSATCSSGKTNCNGACVVLNDDPLHCGDCAVACNAGEICGNGSCNLSCFPGQTACGGSCVDLTSDDQNCGQCDVACTVGQKCNAGKCVLACASGQTDCAGACVDTQSNANNCGACGTACKTGENCNAGKCEVACPGGQTPCSGLCFDLQTDNKNCGACGNACQSGEVCGNGQCSLLCPTGQQNCNGSCADLTTDPNNCGACGTACGATQECSASKCVIACKSLLHTPLGDPWGFSWDGLERAVKTYDQAKADCDSVGGRLPTASELYRVSATQSATVGQSTNTNYLWSVVPYGASSQIQVRLSDGNTLSGAKTLTRNYRCVCPPPLPDAFVGGNCFGPVGQACFGLDAENKKLDIDVQDRPALPKGSAIWECVFYRGHLASPLRLVEAIQQGVGAGSNVYLHSDDQVRSDSDVLLRWQATAAFTLSSGITTGVTTALRPFRCVGPNYAAGTHPATIPNEWVGPLSGLKGESVDTAASAWAAAASTCWSRGGHVATTRELAELVGQGLPAGSGAWLWGADQSAINLTSATLETFKWTGVTVPTYLNGTDLSTAVKTTSAAFRCDYYPVDASYAGPGDANCAGGCSALALPGSSGAKVWFDSTDRAPAATFQAAADACRKLGGHIPTGRDYLEAIRAGLGNGTNAFLWASDFMLVNTNPLTPTYVLRSEMVRWTGTLPTFSDALTTYTSYGDPASSRAYRCMWSNELR